MKKFLLFLVTFTVATLIAAFGISYIFKMFDIRGYATILSYIGIAYMIVGFFLYSSNSSDSRGTAGAYMDNSTQLKSWFEIKSLNTKYPINLMAVAFCFAIIGIISLISGFALYMNF